MNINISTQILSGNLGDGWTDENDAADALGEMTERVWTKDLAEVAAEGHNIEFGIEVCHNTSGSSRDVSVDVDGYDDYETAHELQKRVEAALTDEQTIWSLFCDSDEGAALVSE